jgi:hypothetical protein
VSPCAWPRQPLLRVGRCAGARRSSRSGGAARAAAPDKGKGPQLDPKNLPGSQPDFWESELVGGVFKARRRAAPQPTNHLHPLVLRVLPYACVRVLPVRAAPAQFGYPLIVLAAIGTVLSLAWPVVQTMENTFPKARAVLLRRHMRAHACESILTWLVRPQG